MFPELELKEGWTTVLLLLLMFLCVGWSIQAAHWTDGLGVLQGVVLVSGVTGIVLAKSHTPGLMCHLLSGMAGLSWSAILTSTVLGDVMGLSGQATILELEWRLQAWLVALFSGKTSSGTFVFILLLGLLLWLMAYFAAWAVFRLQRTWLAVTVCGLAILLNMTYARPNLTLHLIAFLLVALLLVVRTNVAWYQQEWRLGQVTYSSDLAGIFLRAGLAVSLLSILLAWVVPEALASGKIHEFLDKAAEPWRRLQDESSRIFQGLNYQNEPRIIAIDRSMRFGGPVSLTDTPVMDIRAKSGRYWRNRVMHAYTGDGWDNTDAEFVILGANDQRLAVLPFQQRRVVSQTVTLLQDLPSNGAIAAAGQPLRASLPLEALVSYVIVGEELRPGGDDRVQYAAPGDPSVLSPLGLLEAGTTFEITSSLSVVYEDSLRKAGTEYPAWVVPRYLSLPESLPERVRSLAKEVTTGKLAVYDQVRAVEAYLRQIPYNEQFEGVPLGWDGVDYFLFEARQGYCTYYASAMVVMLRAVGIPARYVEGYSNSQAVAGVYHIRELDGHAWPEVFFPGYGWIEFEPTAADAVNDRVRPRPTPSGTVGRDANRPVLVPDMEDLRSLMGGGTNLTGYRRPFWQRIGPWGWAGLSLLAIGLVTTVLLAVRRRRSVEGLSAAERVYEDLSQWARRLFRIKPLSHHTPYEYAEVVASNVPRGQVLIASIADAYVRERFGGKTVAPVEAESAWRNVQPLMMRRWVERKTERLRRQRRKPSPIQPVD